MKDLILKIAKVNPGFRAKLIQKLSYDFPTEKALKRYLKEHPKADPRNHRYKNKWEAKDVGNKLKNVLGRTESELERFKDSIKSKSKFESLSPEKKKNLGKEFARIERKLSRVSTMIEDAKKNIDEKNKTEIKNIIEDSKRIFKNLDYLFKDKDFEKSYNKHSEGKGGRETSTFGKLAIEFPTEKALKRYLKEHPKANPKSS